MKPKVTFSGRSQLDRKLKVLGHQIPAPPPHGWIKAIRESLGMSVEQFGHRLGMARQNAAKLEKNEEDGSITLNTLKKAADALSCDLRIVLVPRGSLESILEQRAEQVAKKIVFRSELHMNLEDQGNDTSDQNVRIKEIASELIKNSNKKIWEDL